MTRRNVTLDGPQERALSIQLAEDLLTVDSFSELQIIEHIYEDLRWP